MIGHASVALLAAVWQGVLLAGVVWAGLRMLPKIPAAVRFAVWFAVFLVLAALPFISMWPHAGSATQAAGRGAWLTLDMRWSLGFAVVWGMASLLRAVGLGIAAVRVGGLWKRSIPVSGVGAELVDGGENAIEGSSRFAGPAAFAAATARTNAGVLRFAEKDRIGFSWSRLCSSWTQLCSRQAQLCVSDEIDRPTVIGFWAPRILIPTWLLEKLTAVELEQIVLHESEHLGRVDDWMNLLQKIALVLFPLNPALAWVERQLCFERELAVDDRVLCALEGRPGAAVAYASCLATVAEHRLGRRGFALALGALGRESELGKRVRRILDRRTDTMRPAHVKLIMGGAFLSLIAFAAGLERCPELITFASNAPLVADSAPSGSAIGSLSDKSFTERSLLESLNVPHEVKTVWSVPRSDGPATSPNALRRVSGAARLSRRAKSANSERMMADAGFELRSAALQTIDGGEVLIAQRQQTRSSETQWLLLTEWQDGQPQNAKMVLTVAPIAGRAGRALGARTDTEPATIQDSEQVYPYAAVPVRGGWLVFQL